MSLILLAAFAIHVYVVFSGVRYLWVKHFAKQEHPHFVASVTAASTFFLFAHTIDFPLCSVPNVLWYGFSIFNGQLYLSLIRHYRNQPIGGQAHAGV